MTANIAAPIRDPHLGQLNIIAVYVDKMHQNLLSVHQFVKKGNPEQSKLLCSQMKDADSLQTGAQIASSDAFCQHVQL